MRYFKTLYRHAKELQKNVAISIIHVQRTHAVDEAPLHSTDIPNQQSRQNVWCLYFG